MLHSALHRDVKEVVKHENGHTCAYCGCSNPLMMTIDHRIPLTRGGTNEKTNLVTACIVCNWLKGELTEDEFAEYTEALYVLRKLRKVELKIDNCHLKFNMSARPLDIKEIIKESPKFPESPFKEAKVGGATNTTSGGAT